MSLPPTSDYSLQITHGQNINYSGMFTWWRRWRVRVFIVWDDDGAAAIYFKLQDPDRIVWSTKTNSVDMG